MASKKNEQARRWLLRCPKCHQETGQMVFLPAPGDERDDLPDGLESVTLVQCQNRECLHEWEIVTHAQVLHSLRRWPSNLSPQKGTT